MKYLSDYMNEAQTELFNNTGAFFAFGNTQFDEQKKNGVKYAHLGAGLICPVKNIEQIITGLKTIIENAIRQDVSEDGAEKIIEREYFNYESQISMSTEEAKSALTDYKKLFPELFTDEIIKNTFRNCFSLAVKNDWF